MGGSSSKQKDPPAPKAGDKRKAPADDHPAEPQYAADSLEARLLQQVDFYFGDANFRRDRFLRAKAGEDPNGYVDIDILLTFNKLKAMGVSAAKVGEVMRASDVVDVDEAGKRIRRAHPLPENDDSDERTVYSKVFPQDTTIEQVADLFSQFGTVKFVQFRRNLKTKKFKGSVFVLMDTVENAKAATLAKLCYADQELIVMMKLDYLEMKKEQRKERKKQKVDNANGDDSKKRKQPEVDDDAAAAAAAGAPADDFTEGCVVQVDGLGEGCTREVLKDVFGDFGSNVRFVDYSQGEASAKLRFDTADGPRAVMEKFTSEGIKILEFPEIIVSVLEGDIEKQYWAALKESMAQRKKANRGGGGGRGRGRGGRGRGGRGRGRGRR